VLLADLARQTPAAFGRKLRNSGWEIRDHCSLCMALFGWADGV